MNGPLETLTVTTPSSPFYLVQITRRIPAALPAGPLRSDMTPKPAHTRLLNLIHHSWWTHAVGTTNLRGQLTQRVFYGQYTIAARVGGTRSETQVFFPEASKAKSVALKILVHSHS